jgi:hypothetical protein
MIRLTAYRVQIARPIAPAIAHTMALGSRMSRSPSHAHNQPAAQTTSGLRSTRVGEGSGAKVAVGSPWPLIRRASVREYEGRHEKCQQHERRDDPPFRIWLRSTGDRTDLIFQTSYAHSATVPKQCPARRTRTSRPSNATRAGDRQSSPGHVVRLGAAEARQVGKEVRC